MKNKKKTKQPKLRAQGSFKATICELYKLIFAVYGHKVWTSKEVEKKTKMSYRHLNRAVKYMADNELFTCVKIGRFGQKYYKIAD